MLAPRVVEEHVFGELAGFAPELARERSACDHANPVGAACRRRLDPLGAPTLIAIGVHVKVVEFGREPPVFDAAKPLEAGSLLDPQRWVVRVRLSAGPCRVRRLCFNGC